MGNYPAVRSSGNSQRVMHVDPFFTALRTLSVRKPLQALTHNVSQLVEKPRPVAPPTMVVVDGGDVSAAPPRRPRRLQQATVQASITRIWVLCCLVVPMLVCLALTYPEQSSEMVHYGLAHVPVYVIMLTAFGVTLLVCIILAGPPNSSFQSRVSNNFAVTCTDVKVIFMVLVRIAKEWLFFKLATFMGRVYMTSFLDIVLHFCLMVFLLLLSSHDMTICNAFHTFIYTFELLILVVGAVCGAFVRILLIGRLMLLVCVLCLQLIFQCFYDEENVDDAPSGAESVLPSNDEDRRPSVAEGNPSANPTESAAPRNRGRGRPKKTQ